MYILKPLLRPSESEMLEEMPSNLCSKKPSGAFLCLPKFRSTRDIVKSAGSDSISQIRILIFPLANYDTSRTFLTSLCFNFFTCNIGTLMAFAFRSINGTPHLRYLEQCMAHKGYNQRLKPEDRKLEL